MKFQKYINENSKEEDFNSLMVSIYDKCMPYIKDIAGFGKFIYSGRSGNKDYFTANIRDNRKPLDTQQDIHEMLDKLFNEKFGFKARSNALFVTSNVKVADIYSDTVYMIFPIGDYKFIYSTKIKDLYNSIIAGTTWTSYKNWCNKNEAAIKLEIVEEMKKEEKDYTNPNLVQMRFLSRKNDEYIYRHWKMDKIYKKIPEIVNTYKKGDIKGAINSGNEIMLNCKEYIAVNLNTYGADVIKYINDNGTKGPV